MYSLAKTLKFGYQYNNIKLNFSNNLMHHFNDNFDLEDEDEEEEGPALEIYGTDLTSLARQGQLEECFGREKELCELMEILVRRQKNNPVLVGDAGVGKTAIVELFASKIVNNLVPFILEGRTLISLDLARIVAGSRYRGEFELRFQKVLDEVLEQPNVIIFIDEIHNIGGAGSAEGSLDAANILKPVLSRSGFQCIGATTTKEYQKIEKDPALNRRFQPIRVKEPTIDDTVNILYGLRPSLEAFHNVEIQPSALRLAAELSSRYIYDRFLPDKAIDLVDRAAAKEVIKLTNVTEGSVISSVVNASLNKLGSLKMEAFRRGDIPTEYIFQELENGYRNFLLRWIEDPQSIEEVNDQEKTILSPISQSLFDKMKISVLKRVDDLLFSSNNIRKITKKIQKIQDFTSTQNEQLNSKLNNNIKSGAKLELSIYRISLFLFNDLIKNNAAFSANLESGDVYEFNILKQTCTHLRNLRKNSFVNDGNYSREEDFCSEDIESYEESFEILSELEEKRIDVFKDFLKNLKPLLRKGIIESLKSSSEIQMSDAELSTIYALLGYYSTEAGREFMTNIEDPELIKRARKTGDFSGLKKRITQREIRELLADITGIPLQSISSLETQKLSNLESTLHKRVIGQEEAISAIAKAIKRSRLGIQNPNRPIASFLFCGPTGVGKTEVTKALAVSMFGSESDMIRFDMSEFMEKFTISRLIGSPPGYIGYDEGGQLTDSVRKKPYSVVLFDEVEKAHPDVLNVLLQILEDGRLTDSQKRLVSFENTVLIMTSNAAAEEIQQIIKKGRLKKTAQVGNSTISEAKNLLEKEKTPIYEDEYSGPLEFLGSPINDSFLADIQTQLQFEFEKSFRNLKEYSSLEKSLKNAGDANALEVEQDALKELKSAVLDRLSTMFLPEFLNRLDDIIVFQPLKPEELRKICDIMVKSVADRVQSKQIELHVDENVKLKLTREGYNPMFGARPLRRLVTKYVEDLVSESLLKNPLIKKGRVIKIVLNEYNQVVIQEDKAAVLF